MSASSLSSILDDIPCPRGWGRLSHLLFAFAFLIAHPPAVCGGERPRSPDEPSREEIRGRVAEVLDRLSQVRGIPAPPSVRVSFEGKEFFRRHYLETVSRGCSPERLRGQAEAYVLLGFLPSGRDPLRVQVEAFLKEVKGVYDPRTRSLCFADWVPPEEWEETLVHESAHALQDARHDLGAFLDRAAGKSLDRQYAAKSLVEGEATALTLEMSLSDQGRRFADIPDLGRLDRLHRVIERGRRLVSGRLDLPDLSRTFHYVRGAAFVQRAVRRSGWKGVDALWSSPPLSTEQVLHPEKYYGRREAPTAVRIEGLETGSLSGWHRIWEDTFGEFGLALVLGRQLPEEEAARACKGWAGDRLGVFERDGRRVLVAYTLWDDEGSAAAFFEAYRRLLRAKRPDSSMRRIDDTVDWSSLPDRGGEAFLERLGRRVLILEGTPPGLTEAVRGDLWKRRQKKVGDLEPWL